VVGRKKPNVKCAALNIGGGGGGRVWKKNAKIKKVQKMEGGKGTRKKQKKT